MVARINSDGRVALEFARAGLRHFQASGRAVPRAHALFRVEVAAALSQNGWPAEAEREFNAALRLFEAAHRSESADAITLHNIWGLAAMDTGNPRSGLEHLDRSIAIARRLTPDKEISGSLVFNRALALRALARYGEARKAFLEVLDQAVAQGDAENEQFALQGLAVTAARAGDLGEAQRRLAAATAVIERGNTSGSAHYSVMHRSTQGIVWQQMGMHAQARAAITSVLDYLTERGMRQGNLSQLLVIRSESFARDGEAVLALADAEEALEIARTTQGDQAHSYLTGQAWLSVGRLHREAGRLDKARDAAGHAVAHLAATVDAEHPLLRLARSLAASLS
jgi:tetratricopeptide (TPR) repeat protein